MGAERKKLHTLCRMCAERCGLNIYMEDGRIVDIDGCIDQPYNQGVICSKGRAAVDLVYHPDRILKPLKKTEEGWQEIELEQALDEIAEKFLKIQKEYGPQSMSVWKGEGVGFAQEEDIARRFIHAAGSPNYFSNDTACWVGKYIGYSLGYGQWQQPDFPDARCMMLWGTNPPYSQAMLTREMMEAKEKGAKLIVVDPRLSAIARQADIYVPIRPGTDGALALGLVNLLIENGWYDQDFIKKYTVGFEKLAVYVRKFTPKFVEQETSVPASIVREIAKLLHQGAPRVSFYMGNGMEHHINGVNNVRAVSCLDALLGSLDVKGGNRLWEGAGIRDITLYKELPLKELEPIGADKYPVLYDFRQECHTMLGMDVLLTDEPYPIRGMLMTAANPVLTNPNSKKVIEALSRLELFVVRDLFMTETAELADYFLPAASFLERTELHTDCKFNILNLTRKIISFPDCQDEYQFWHDMAHRLGCGKYFPWENETELNRWMLEPTKISLEDLEKHPEGICYKPIEYRKWESETLATPTGKVEIASQYLKDLGFDELPEYHAPEYLTHPDPQFPFVMVTGARKMLYVHGKFRNIPRFRTAIPEPEVELHPKDAAKIGVKTGDVVRITSRIASVDVPVQVMAENEIMTGVCQVTHGWKEANINDITIDDEFDPISGFPALKSIPVRIEKVKYE